jgi:hypothetical protein
MDAGRPDVSRSQVHRKLPHSSEMYVQLYVPKVSFRSVVMSEEACLGQSFVTIAVRRRREARTTTQRRTDVTRGLRSRS